MTYRYSINKGYKGRIVLKFFKNDKSAHNTTLSTTRRAVNYTTRKLCLMYVNGIMDQSQGQYGTVQLYYDNEHWNKTYFYDLQELEEALESFCNTPLLKLMEEAEGVVAV